MRLTKEQRAKLADRLASVGIAGCGDNSCVIIRPVGMATNGGCQCLKQAGRLEDRRLIAALGKVLHAYALEDQP